MTKRHSRLYTALFLLLLTGCQGALRLLPPRFVNQVQPALSVDFSPFENVGCPPTKYGDRLCEEGSSLAALSCAEIRKPSDLLGALEPSHPIAICYAHPLGADNTKMIEEGKYLFNDNYNYPLMINKS
jgi:hypothetical protein